MADSGKRDAFEEALVGKHVPVLTLDKKWYRLLDALGRESVKSLEDELNELLRRQGKLNSEIKEIKRLKKRLMSEIVPMADEMNQGGDPELEKQIEEHKRLIAECNEKLDGHQDEMLDLPREIDRVNVKLMLMTMDYCYDEMQENTDEIDRIADWIAQVRVELKKNIVRKQEMEQKNHQIYSYMHDIFGARIVDLFDMKYDPEKQHPHQVAPKPEIPETKPAKTERKGSEMEDGRN